MVGSGFDVGVDADDFEDIVDAGEAAVAGAVGAAACFACGEAVSGRYCRSCGQRHDQMRRNIFLLFWDYLRETFDFDSRMWRTSVALFARPGVAAREYSHGARSRYTPPIRMFLFISFLFFLALSLTHTYFAAFDVRYGPQKPDGAVNFNIGPNAPVVAPTPAGESAPEAPKEAGGSKESGVYLNGDSSRPTALPKFDPDKCPTGAELKFFVKASDIKPARADLGECFRLEAEKDATDEQRQTLGIVERFVRGGAAMAADPDAFNKAINDWIPRIMFAMTPVLALIMSIFFRGKKDAMLFDNVLQSLHLHAALFIIVGVAIVAAQFNAPYVAPAAFGAIAIYLVAALKNGYRRGWIKTIWSAGMISVLYSFVLSAALAFIVSRVIYDAG
ncbi:MAG: DUF3667 domain-containing protein [Parvularculaceae bacterium]|nr:DUF3667 domain-containing protein [Parvularculaceae bacterium]